MKISSFISSIISFIEIGFWAAWAFIESGEVFDGAESFCGSFWRIQKKTETFDRT